MGNDASSIKENATISQKILNIHVIEQNLNRFTEQTENNSENQSMKYVKVDNTAIGHRHFFLICVFCYVRVFLQSIRYLVSLIPAH
jgi:fucose permease